MIPESSQRLREAAKRLGIELDVRRFPEHTKTAEAAAAAIGCPVAAIIKSLVFVVEFADGRREPVLALVPGDRRLDAAALAEMGGGLDAVRAGLDEAKAATGYVAGGTPPFGHSLRVFADNSLRRYDELWAGGGTPDTVFRISLDDLERSTAAVWGDLS